MVGVRFNGKPLGQPVDTYSPEVDAKWVVFGTVDVESEASTLRLEAVDRNPASDGYHAGIDALTLVPAR